VSAGPLTIGDVLRRSTGHLAGRGAEQPRLDAERLLAHALGMERVELYMHLDRPLSSSELEDARALLARRATGEPLQYVLGEWGFRRLTLRVDSRALIPRPETETVVERCLALLDGADAPRVLDVGTGSGAVALALADEHPGARVTAIDVSEDALALARENAERAGVAVELLRHDLFAGLPGDGWDLVVSNPPYVGSEELASLAPEVVDWEPGVALVDQGHTEALARGAQRALRPGGALVLETHEHGAAGVAKLLEREGYVAVRVTPDLAGRDRVVEGRTRA
jgi:release factor glutamine methyltransferase